MGGKWLGTQWPQATQSGYKSTPSSYTVCYTRKARKNGLYSLSASHKTKDAPNQLRKIQVNSDVGIRCATTRTCTCVQPSMGTTCQSSAPGDSHIDQRLYISLGDVHLSLPSWTSLFAISTWTMDVLARTGKEGRIFQTGLLCPML